MSLLTVPNTLLRRIRKNWKIFLFIVIIATIAGIIGSRRAGANEELTFISPQRQDLTKSLEVSGVVDAQKKARLRFLAGGKLTYLGVTEGDSVERWDLLAQIDQRTLQKQLQQDLNNYMQERWDWESDRDDTEYRLEDLDTRRSLDKSQWDLENEVLDVEIRDVAIDNTRLYAPFDGIMTLVPTDTKGVQLTNADYFELIDPDSLMIVAQIDEVDISEVKVGQPVEIQLDAYRNRSFQSEISFISYRSSQSNSGTVYLAEIKLPTSSEDDRAIATGAAALELFRLGMNGDVSIKVETQQNALTIPLNATRLRDGAHYVDVRTGPESYEERQIEISMETSDTVAVSSGLDLDDEILLPNGTE